MNKGISTNSKLIMANGIALFIGTIMDTMSHKHHAIQLTFGMDKSFYIQWKDGSVQSRSILINSDIKHKLIGQNGTQALLLIEPESNYGEILKNKIIRNQSIVNLDYNLHNDRLQSMISSNNLKTHEIIDSVFDHLNIPVVSISSVDSRISRITQMIDRSYHKKITINELADNVSLSVSRLQHIFKEQMGITIKRYMLWKKMIEGVKIIANQNSFTFAAHEAGFSDSSHMSRTFKEMFGLTLSNLFKNSSSLQVLIEDN